MKLLRFAMIQFRTAHPIDSCRAEIGDVVVELTGVESDAKDSQALLAIAEAQLPVFPSKDESDRIIIDKDIRENCEFGIDTLANLISVLEGCPRSIFSPAPCFVLEFENEEERQFLQSSRGIHVIERKDVGARLPIEYKPEIVSQLTDRLDGIAILSEFYTSGEVGRYRELVRYFELAFKLQFAHIDKKLFKFLEPTPFGYLRTEIKEWISFRHSSTHADKKKTATISFTSDVQGFLMRMEQAAVDVLFNKAHWRSSSTTRRNTWMPIAWSTSRSGGMAVVKDSKNVSLLVRVYDEFGVYPRKLGLAISDIKENWYFALCVDHLPKPITQSSPNDSI